MNNFSIAQLAQFSGIRAHTIRIWEQRYNALKPQRTEGNTRFYDGEQLRRLLNMVSLINAGHKVSEIGVLSDERLYELIEELNNITGNLMEEFFISQLIAAGITFDEASFEKTFSHCLLRHGMKETYTKILYPMLIRVGVLWSANLIPPAQEHFISNIVRQKLYTAIDSVAPSKHNAETWVLFLPEDELHEIGLLLGNYLLRIAGKRVIYLGANVPITSVKTAVDIVKAEKLLLFLVHRQLPEDLTLYLNTLAQDFKDKQIYVAMDLTESKDIDKPAHIHFLHTIEDLSKVLPNNYNS